MERENARNKSQEKQEREEEREENKERQKEKEREIYLYILGVQFLSLWKNGKVWEAQTK